MPLKIPANLPAFQVLKQEGVMVMSDDDAARQDIRPLNIRLIGATPLQINLSLIRMSEHHTKNTAAEHMSSFYRAFQDVKASGEKFDGLIITGAPIEHLPFEQVTYWDELQEVFEWTQSHVHATFAVCWGSPFRLDHAFG